jgi:hypothetical protein
MKIVSIKGSWLNSYSIAAFIIFSSLLIQVSPIAAQTPAVKNVVIVHGAFADGSGRLKAPRYVLELVSFSRR